MFSEIRIDKIASAALRAASDKCVRVLTNTTGVVSGDLVVVRALTESLTYGNLELPEGRLARIKRGDVILGVLGRRRALKGFVGDVPEQLTAGDRIHLLNMGGVMGIASGHHSSLSDAIELEVLGMAAGNNGRPINLKEYGIPPARKLNVKMPLILVTGVCMNSGKTESAIELIKEAVRRGLAPAGVKLTGIACLRDTLNMADHGAIATASFVDCGLPSTAGEKGLADVARAVLNKAASFEPDLIVAELGDGVVGGYGVGQILADAEIMSRVTSIVFCATDYVGVIGGIKVLRQYNLAPDVIAGPVTDSIMGETFVRENFGFPAANSRRNPEVLFDFAAEGCRHESLLMATV